MDENNLRFAVECFSSGKFDKAEKYLQKIKNPRRYGKDIYILSLYLLYFNFGIQKLPYEEFRKRFLLCGLTESEMEEVSNSLSKYSKLQYYIEKPSFTRYLILAFSLLFTAWLWKKISSKGETDIFPSISYTPEKNIPTRFSDVIGLGDSLDEVKLLVKYLQDPSEFKLMGIKQPTGVLLTGPPGTGKTLLARAIAGEASVPFFFVSGSEFDEMFVGMGARRVRRLFEEARKHAPCIVFIDEIDAVGLKRSFYSSGSGRQTVNQLLNEIGGFHDDEGILVIAATNLKHVLDPALIRPGRFDVEIQTSLPDREARETILKKITSKSRLSKDVNLEVLSRLTIGFSGAELESLINIAAMIAVSDGSQDIGFEHIQEALDRIQMGSKQALGDNKQAIRNTIIHECGHALVSLLTDGALPIGKITIIPRGNALGYVTNVLSEEELYSRSRKQLLASIDVAMGGRAAEEVFFGKDRVTTGAENDLQQASQMAKRAVYEWGMGSTPRVRTEVDRYTRDPLPNYSEATKRKNDLEIEEILSESYNRVKSLIESNKQTLLKLADAVEENETISGEDAQRIVNGETLPRQVGKKAKDNEKEKALKAKNKAEEENKTDIDEYVLQMAKAMVQLRLEEEKVIFDRLWAKDKK